MKDEAEGGDPEVVNLQSEILNLKYLSSFQSGVAQGGESARLINERVRVQLPPPRPNSIRGYDLTG
jgi:hypothetical protein